MANTGSIPNSSGPQSLYPLDTTITSPPPNPTDTTPALAEKVSTEKELSAKKSSTLASLKSGGLGFLKGLKWAGKRGAAVGGTILFGALTLASAGIIPATGVLLIHLGRKKDGASGTALHITGSILALPLTLALGSANYVVYGEFDGLI